MNPNLLETEDAIADLVRRMKTIAVLGIQSAAKPEAPAFTIPQLLIEMHYEVTGINPVVPEAFGRANLASVENLPAAVDVLDVFRRSDAIPAIADQLLAMPAERRPRAVWLQSGIRHDEAAARLAEAGMQVVQDRCLGVYARRYR